MADAATLLRMLEPTVRPVQAPPTGAGAATPPAPLEQRAFESLLAEAQHGATAPPDSEQDAGEARGAASPLHGLDRIENASLRRLMAEARSAAAPPNESQ